MANITSFNVNDVALYYQALELLAADPLETARATEPVRERLVTYMERRRAAIGLPPLRGEMTTLGEKVILELRQMRLVEKKGERYQVTMAGREIISQLAAGGGRRARRLLLSRMLDSYDNLFHFVVRITPPDGVSLSLPIPRAPSSNGNGQAEPDVESESSDSVEIESVCDSWERWCQANGRDDLLPEHLHSRASELSSRMRGSSVGRRIQTALQQLVLERWSLGSLKGVPLYRTMRDRLCTAGALNTWLQSAVAPLLSVETTYSCLHVGAPQEPTGWVRLDATRFPAPVYIHEPEPPELAVSLLAALTEAASSLVPRAGYYRIFELRDRVCETLRISQGVFDAAFVRIYKSNPGILTLGVDYETVTARRLPIQVREGNRVDYFNLVAFRNTKGG